jgi:type IV secretory pathway TrbD component
MWTPFLFLRLFRLRAGFVLVMWAMAMAMALSVAKKDPAALMIATFTNSEWAILPLISLCFL